MIYNYLREVFLRNNLENCKMIPINGCPTSFYEIKFKGWNKITLSSEDQTFNELIDLASKTLMLFVELYKDRFAFSEPMLSFTPKDSIVSIKIGMMEIEIFNQRYENEE